MRWAPLLLGAALLDSARSELHNSPDLFVGCPRQYVRGLLLHFDKSYDVYNNLGGFAGGEQLGGGGGVACTSVNGDNIPYGEYPPGGCPCGCGCSCTNAEQVAPPGTRQELRYRDVATLVGSDGREKKLDLVVTNLTEYTPWNSRNTGFHDGGHFAQISMYQDTETTFKYELQDPQQPRSPDIHPGGGFEPIAVEDGASALAALPLFSLSSLSPALSLPLEVSGMVACRARHA